MRRLFAVCPSDRYRKEPARPVSSSCRKEGHRYAAQARRTVQATAASSLSAHWQPGFACLPRSAQTLPLPGLYGRGGVSHSVSRNPRPSCRRFPSAYALIRYFGRGALMRRKGRERKEQAEIPTLPGRCETVHLALWDGERPCVMSLSFGLVTGRSRPLFPQRQRLPVTGPRLYPSRCFLQSGAMAHGHSRAL